LHKQQQANTRFLVGADISMLGAIEELGGVFREDEKPKDLLQILKGHGCNCLRLRLFVNPTTMTEWSTICPTRSRSPDA
jgi:arabinogalactan endo-1,4-beta-galactosidase